MKKYIFTSFLVALLLISSVVPAFAAGYNVVPNSLLPANVVSTLLSLSDSALLDVDGRSANISSTNISWVSYSYLSELSTKWNSIGQIVYNSAVGAYFIVIPYTSATGGTTRYATLGSMSYGYVYGSRPDIISDPSASIDYTSILRSIYGMLWTGVTIDGLDHGTQSVATMLAGVESSVMNIWLKQQDIYNSLNSFKRNFDDYATTATSALFYQSGQRQYSVASLLYSCQLYLDHLETKLTATNGYIDELESKIDTTNSRLGTANTYLSNIKDNISGGFTTLNGYVDGVEGKLDTSNTRLNALNTTASNGFSNVSSKLTDIENALSNIGGTGNNTYNVQPYDDSNVLDKFDILTDEVYRSNSNLNTIDSHVDGLESSIVVTNNRISTVDIDLNNFYASTSAGFADVLNNFSRVSGQLVDIQNLLSGLNNSPVVSTINSPYVRKIYNVLYDGVDGSGTDMVDIATSQMGVSEGRPYYTWYGFNSHVEWCAVFVSWCADQCGYLDDIIPKFAVVDDGVNWFKSRSLWLDGGQAEVIPGVETKTITPVRITDNGHNYVTIYVDISDDGTLTVSGAGKNGGKFYNPEIEPSVADFSGNQTVTVYWGGSASAHRSDSRQVRLVYDVNTVTSGGGYSDVVVGASEPSPGDIIFFDWDVDHDPDHVGIVADCTDGIVTTVEGNTGDTPGVVSSRTIAYDSPLIYGYGTPDYPSGGGASIYSVLVDISNKLGRSSAAGISSYDDTVLLSKLTDIEEALNDLGGNIVISIDNVTNVDIPLDNDAHDVFYVTDDDGDKSIVDLSGNSVKIVGKLMNFLYQAMFKDALNDADSSIQGLYDFYLDNSEGVDVWAS